MHHHEGWFAGEGICARARPGRAMGRWLRVLEPRRRQLQVASAFARIDADDRSWWLFPKEHRVRQACSRVAAYKWFGRGILTLVLASCVVMALEDPGCTDACKQQAVLNEVQGGPPGVGAGDHPGWGRARTDRVVGGGWWEVGEGSQCLEFGTNPNYGFTSFDNFGAAALCIFQMLTLDAWTSGLLYPLMNAVGPAVPVPYFTLLVLFGAFFAMQLLVAILSSTFAELSAKRPKPKRKKRRPKHSPPDSTEGTEYEYDPKTEEGGGGGGGKGGGGGERAAVGQRRRPPLATRVRRWWRHWWFHLRKDYLQALRRKELPHWRAM
ncbi:Voltage-dependent L-type calcium channel subunit alpha-1C [Tetrabaena socialis]|uniref:Voltage-dependent L-type calcium channel subunit alpha-1C n=1 Tax=Tetrabaena socialis TaxID=47790 RepID=A0A2J8A2V7_9CHLO|nr:Voltage-dependent L-type calcium channel subunit alpha-1C [Tetrabaena socialis]|eukprot:PNH06857.1 Voltage-dependent L-type calcium channel subunit alpha-1C [Tetrabaena socialis]